MRIPIFLNCRTFRDTCGTEITIRERRLIREHPDDRIIAIVEAPEGTRIRHRPDHFGSEQLLVPQGRGLWSRWFGFKVVIPAKYVIGKARHGECGLSLVPLPETESPRVPDDACTCV